MTDKLIKWISTIDAAKHRDGHLTELDKHRAIADKLLESATSTNLNILIKAASIESTLIDITKLEAACIQHAPLLLDGLRTIDSANKPRIEAHILKQLAPDECLVKVTKWYGSRIPSQHQDIIGWKIYNQCYSDLTSGQIDDRVLNENIANTLVQALELIPTVLNSPVAVLQISKAAAYVMRNGDTNDFKTHNLPDNFNELALSALWSYVSMQQDTVSKNKWTTQASTLTLGNKKLIDANLSWLQMHQPTAYNQLLSFKHADTKEISSYLTKERKKNGLADALLSKKHADNNPGSLDAFMPS